MASGHTEHFQLNQWSLDDAVQMEEFNADNRKVEQALTELDSSCLRIAFGSYTGTGKYGQANANTLTFPFRPRLFYCYRGMLSDIFTLVHSGMTGYTAPDLSTDDLGISLTWTDNSLSWYNSRGAFAQLNEKDKVYHYMVIGDKV